VAPFPEEDLAIRPSAVSPHCCIDQCPNGAHHRHPQHLCPENYIEKNLRAAALRPFVSGSVSIEGQTRVLKLTGSASNKA